MPKHGKLFIVSGPSGVGKSTLVDAVLPMLKQHVSIERLITYTSKTPRAGERNGVDYHFVTPQEFEAKIKVGFFLEWSTAYGTYYGTPSSVIQDLASGTSYILVIDRVGARQIREKVLVVSIWLELSDVQALEVRLRNRRTETEAQIRSRIDRALVEIAEEKSAPFYTYHVKNDDFEAAKSKIFSIICKELDCSSCIC